MLQERGNPCEGYLFVSTTKGKGDKLEVRSINEAIKALAEKAFTKEKASEFETKSLRSFYNSALLRAGIQPQELKDLMFGHRRKGARSHYDYDEQTIKENYAKVFEYLSINGLQTRTDVIKLKEDLNKTKVEFADIVSEQKAKFEKEIKDMHNFVHKNLDPVLDLFNEIASTPEGKELVKRITEKKREDEAIKFEVLIFFNPDISNALEYQGLDDFELWKQSLAVGYYDDLPEMLSETVKNIQKIIRWIEKRESGLKKNPNAARKPLPEELAGLILEPLELGSNLDFGYFWKFHPNGRDLSFWNRLQDDITKRLDLIRRGQGRGDFVSKIKLSQLYTGSHPIHLDKVSAQMKKETIQATGTRQTQI